MNKIERVTWLLICLMVLCLMKPIHGKAADLSIGNLLGIEGQVILMNQDIMFLNTEIDRLSKECE